MLDRPAVVKVLLPEFSRNREVVNRFFNEARAATAVRHPGIVEIYDFGYLPDGNAYIIMEFLDGESLAARLRRVGRLPVRDALLLTRQIAGALHAAHTMQIVHRDLKPDNIFVVRDPEVAGGERIKLLDFGIAKLASNGGESSRTRTGAVIGTPTYMAPEQCRGAGTVDFRADLYALGCILYELLSGRPPFLAEGDGDIIAHHLYFAPESLRRHDPSIPVGIEEFVMSLLQKEPGARPASAMQLIGAINRLSHGTSQGDVNSAITALSTPALAAVDAQTTLSGAASHADTSSAPTSRRARRFVAASLGLALIGGLIVALQLPRGDSPVSTNAPAPMLPPPAAMPPQVVTPHPVATPSSVAMPSDHGTENFDVSRVARAAPTTVTVTIESVPAGAEVRVAGRLLGVTPFTETVPRSDAKRTFIVSRAGYLPANVVIAGNVDETTRVELRRRSRPPSSPESRKEDHGLNPFD